MATHLSNMFSLLSVGFAPPTIERARLVTSGTFAREVAETWEALGLDKAEADAFTRAFAVYEGRDDEEVLHEIRQEYTRLFLVNHLIENTEGPWRKKDSGARNVFYMINSISTEIQDFMKMCGVVRPAGYNDSVDLIDNEWYFASILADDPAYLAEQGISAEERLTDFVENHLKLWIPGFSAQVKEESRIPYYRALADIQARLVEAL